MFDDPTKFVSNAAAAIPQENIARENCIISFPSVFSEGEPVIAVVIRVTVDFNENIELGDEDVPVVGTKADIVAYL